jgi:hypothetical protein
MADSRELWNRLEILLETAVVAASGCGVPVSSSAVEYDEQVMDECDCSNSTGHAYIRVNRIFPTATRGGSFPQQALQPTNCPAPLAAEVRLGIWRCVANLDNNGGGPSPENRTEDARQIIVDSSLLYNVLMSHNPVWSIFPVTIRDWTQLSAQEGSCSGGYWTFYIDVDLCSCGPEQN